LSSYALVREFQRSLKGADVISRVLDLIRERADTMEPKAADAAIRQLTAARSFWMPSRKPAERSRTVDGLHVVCRRAAPWDGGQYGRRSVTLTQPLSPPRLTLHAEGTRLSSASRRFVFAALDDAEGASGLMARFTYCRETVLPGFHRVEEIGEIGIVDAERKPRVKLSGRNRTEVSNLHGYSPSEGGYLQVRYGGLDRRVSWDPEQRINAEWRMISLAIEQLGEATAELAAC
jgi:hypothetical protein